MNLKTEQLILFSLFRTDWSNTAGKRGVINMWILMLSLTILNLIFVYKKKFLATKITILITTILYCVLSWYNILELIIMIQNGIVGMFDLIWDLFNLVLLVSLCISIFRKNRKMSLILLWVIIFMLLLGKWNTWLTYIFYLKSLLNK